MGFFHNGPDLFVGHLAFKRGILLGHDSTGCCDLDKIGPFPELFTGCFSEFIGTVCNPGLQFFLLDFLQWDKVGIHVTGGLGDRKICCNNARTR